MKVLILFAVVVCYVSAVEYTLENCQCHSHYEAQKDSNGKVQCVGKMLSHIMPCNIPEAPRCICTQHPVTGITTDSEGTWCTQSAKGVTQQKWPCENTEEWAAYKVKLDEYKKTLKE